MSPFRALQANGNLIVHKFTSSLLLSYWLVLQRNLLPFSANYKHHGSGIFQILFGHAYFQICFLLNEFGILKYVHKLLAIRSDIDLAKSKSDRRNPPGVFSCHMILLIKGIDPHIQEYA